jgi:hypothetical protein
MSSPDVDMENVYVIGNWQLDVHGHWIKRGSCVQPVRGINQLESSSSLTEGGLIFCIL